MFRFSIRVRNVPALAATRGGLPKSKVAKNLPPNSKSAVAIFPLHLDPPTLQHLNIFANLLAPSTVTRFDHIILIPNTRFIVSIFNSIHLAAMTQLAVRDFPNVSVDFAALETPDSSLPRVRELLNMYPNASVVHWLPDLHDVTLWKGCREWADRVPFLLLKPASMDTNIDDDKQLRSQMWLPAKSTIIEVDRTAGADVRAFLFDGEGDPGTIVPAAVLRYIDSHGLYRDFRKSKKYFFGSSYNACVSEDSGGTHQSRVALSGTIPRLQLYYDPANATACELAAKLRPFSVMEGDETPDLIVPIGGDGWMMHCIRKNWRRYIPFFGVNAGHLGYLLNNAAGLTELISRPLRLHLMPMLYCAAESVDRSLDPVTKELRPKRLEEIAFNDAWVERSSGQTVLLNVKVNGVERMRRVRGDGVLVSTAAGSTAYALALGASPLPVGVPLIQLVGSNIVSPSQWKPVHLNSDVEIDLECVDGTKRPCRGFVDSIDVGIIQKMKIRSSRVAGVQMAFVESCDLQSKLYTLQFPGGTER